MKAHPPDRHLDRPEPDADYFREEALRAEWEEERRREFTRLMERVKRTISDAYDQETAEAWMQEIWDEINRGRAA